MPQKSKETTIYPSYDGSGTGQRVAHVRSFHGLSQADLAQKIGITRNRLAHYESGRIQLSAEMLARLAIELRVSADELLGLTPTTAPPPVIPTRIIKLVERSMKIDDDGRLMIFRYMRGVLNIYEPKPAVVEQPKTPAKTKPAKSARPVKQTVTRVRDDDLFTRHTGAWVQTEIEVLELYYPRCEDKSIILDLLPGRSWYECATKAHELGIKRLVDEKALARAKKPKAVLPKDKLATLLRQDLTLEEIAQRMKTTVDIVRRHMWRYGL